MARILTGIQSTGRPHLGNLLGSIIPAIALSKQEKNESLFFIADLHSFTAIRDAETLKENTYATAAAWLAFGFDTDKNLFYRQSDVTEVTELTWYLNCFTPFPMLANAHSFKDKSNKLSDVNAGLFTYPVLMAADILLYDAEIVPVGKDQMQHLEMTRDIAGAFNHKYPNSFVIPETKVDERVMIVPGTDGQKMSKSYNNGIDIFLSDKKLKKQIMGIKTDSTPMEEKKNAEDCNVFQLYKLLGTDNQIANLKEKYGEERRTEVIEKWSAKGMEDMIADEEVVLTVTHNGYIKRTNINTYRSQRRGGRGVQGAGSREEDFVEHLFTATNHSYILFFTDRGKCYWVKVYDIPEGGRAAKGRAIINLIECEPDEKVNAFIAVKDFSEDHYVVMATEKGKVKKTVLSAYSHPRKKGIYAVEIREGDKLIEARVSTGDNDILLGTRNGKSIRFSEQQIRPSGRKTMGVKGITLSSKDDKVIGMLLIKREGTTVLVATENGFGKRTDISQYRPQKRGGKGVLTMKTTDRVGKMIAIKEAIDSDDLMIITTRGVLIRQSVSKIRVIGRATQGVKLINLDKGSKVASITRIISDDEKEPETDEPNSKELEED